jgi:arginine/ornithine N-succinyltransferase beta subunit
MPGSGQAEQHLLEKIGLCYLHGVDPLDGGILYGSKAADIRIVGQGGYYRAKAGDRAAGAPEAFVGVSKVGGFRGGRCPVLLEADEAIFAASALERLEVAEGDLIYVSRV